MMTEEKITVSKTFIIHTMAMTIRERINDINQNQEPYDFFNNFMRCHLITCIGNYSVVYDEENNRLIGAYLLKTDVTTGKGSWCQGYYFDGDWYDNQNDIKVSEWLYDKVFRE